MLTESVDLVNTLFSDLIKRVGTRVAIELARRSMVQLLLPGVAEELARVIRWEEKLLSTGKGREN